MNRGMRQSTTTSADDCTRFLLTDISLTETCQSEEAAANEKKSRHFLPPNKTRSIFFQDRRSTRYGPMDKKKDRQSRRQPIKKKKKGNRVH